MRTVDLTVARTTIRAIVDRLARTVAAVVVAQRSLFCPERLMHPPAWQQGRMPRGRSEWAGPWAIAPQAALGLAPCWHHLAARCLRKHAGKGRARPGRLSPSR